jgi:hypothetical protein
MSFKLERSSPACSGQEVTFSFANSDLGRAKAQGSGRITFSQPQLYANGKPISFDYCDLNNMSFRVNASKLIPAGKVPPCDGLVQFKLQVANSAACNSGQAQYQATSQTLTVRIKPQHPLPAFKLQPAGYNCQQGRLYFNLDAGSALVRAIYEGDIQITGQQLFAPEADDQNNPVPAGKWGFLTNTRPPSFWVDAGVLRPAGYSLPFDATLILSLQINNKTGCGQQTYSLDSEYLLAGVVISPTHRGAINSFTLRISRIVETPQVSKIFLSYANQPLSQALGAGAIYLNRVECYLVEGTNMKKMDEPWLVDDRDRANFIISLFNLNAQDGIRALRGRKLRVKMSIVNNTRCGPKTYDSWSQVFTLPEAVNQ